MKQLIILGAGGHGRVCAEIAAITYDSVLFLDNNLSLPGVVGAVDDYVNYKDSDFFVAIGNNAVRQKFCQMLSDAGCNLVSLVAPGAMLSHSVTYGRGCVFMNGSVVNADAVLADGVIVNTCASVDHDCTVGPYSHISVGAHLCGTVTLGEDVNVYAGATIINNLDVADHTVIGAGATVIRDIPEPGVYAGVPAKPIRACGKNS